MSTGVILLAAGSGRRFGGRRPKQMARLNGGPLYVKPLNAFLKVPSVGEIVVVTSKGLIKNIVRRVKKYGKKIQIRVILGGVFRGESVRNGLKALSSKSKIVLVHDAARPLVSEEVIERVIRGVRQTGVALAAWPLGDTLKESDAKGRVRRTIPRNNLWLAQTPQGFRREIAEKCLRNPNAIATDDVQLAERKGFKVKIVEGSPFNFKVTFPHDLKTCQAIIKAQ